MTNKTEWIEWHGGEPPVPSGTHVDVLTRGMGHYYDVAIVLPSTWRHNYDEMDIVAYRLHETAEQRIDRLEREVAELKEHQRPGKPEPEKWEPEGGTWYLYGNGDLGKGFISGEDYRKFGTERPTRELAEKARDVMRVHNRALAYVHEHAPDFDECPMTDHYEIYFCNRWVTRQANLPSVGAVTGPGWVMQKLADELNAGTVEL